ncbi:MAG: nitroreductase [Fuerstiella sp.]
MSSEEKIDRMTADTIEQCIRSRRSVKPAAFSDVPVANEIIDRMLEAANWAPTHGCTEPWRFFVHTNEARIKLGNKIAELYMQITKPENCSSATAEKLKNFAAASSHLIVIAMKRQESGKISRVDEVAAVACAVQNLHLMATACGAAGYWSSAKAICCDLMKDHLGLGAEDEVLGMFYVGTAEGELPEGKRKPIADKVSWFGRE